MSTEQIWRGPRPLRLEDQLIGRDRPLATALTVLGSRSILEITAPSGVGKSSFIAAGLLRSLRARGEDQPLYAPESRWADLMRRPELSEAADDQRGRLLYELALADCAVADAPGTTVRSYSDVASDESGYPPVVFFDQFEECIRYNPRLADQLMAFITEWSAESGVRHIVAARSEYKEQLRVLESNVEAEAFHLSLAPITGKTDIEKVINLPAEGRLTIPEEVTSRIYGWWSEATSGTTSSAGVVARDPGAIVGLLHLQSLLWLLDSRLRPDQTELTTDDLTIFDDVVRRDGVVGLFTWAMTEYVRTTLKGQLDPTVWWTEKDTGVGGPVRPPADIQERVRTWSSGPQQLVAQVARFLSTSGYKVPQSYRTLLSLIVTGGSGSEESRRIMAATSADPDAILSGWEATGAGVAHDWDSTDVVRTVAWTLREALDRMSGSEINILRPYLGRVDAIFELVHDGLGLALRRWAEGGDITSEPGLLDSPAAIFNSIYARAGRDFPAGLSASDVLDGGSVRWGWDANARPLADERGPKVALDHLSWVGSNIWHREFEQVAVVDSKLTGSVFGLCTLRDVRFEQCDLRGAVVIGGTLAGVEIVGGGADMGGIDTLTFNKPVDGVVTFTDLADTNGLFLNEISGGHWTFTNCHIKHLHISGAEKSTPVELTFTDCDIDLVSFGAHLTTSTTGLTVTRTTFAHVVDEAGLGLA